MNFQAVGISKKPQTLLNTIIWYLTLCSSDLHISVQKHRILLYGFRSLTNWHKDVRILLGRYMLGHIKLCVCFQPIRINGWWNVIKINPHLDNIYESSMHKVCPRYRILINIEKNSCHSDLKFEHVFRSFFLDIVVKY